MVVQLELVADYGVLAEPKPYIYAPPGVQNTFYHNSSSSDWPLSMGRARQDVSGRPP